MKIHLVLFILSMSVLSSAEEEARVPSSVGNELIMSPSSTLKNREECDLLDKNIREAKLSGAAYGTYDSIPQWEQEKKVKGCDQ